MNDITKEKRGCRELITFKNEYSNLIYRGSLGIKKILEIKFRQQLVTIMKLLY